MSWNMGGRKIWHYTGKKIDNGLSPSWTPHYANIVQYFQFNGSGQVQSPIPAKIGNVGTYNGASTPTIQYVNSGYIPNWKSIQFSGGSQYLTAGSGGNFDQPIVNLNVWLKLSTLNQYNPICFCSQASDWGIGFDGTNQMILVDQNGAGIASGVMINDNNWHMVTVTFDLSGAANFYLDSILENSQAATGLSLNFNGAPYCIGSDQNDGNYFSGNMDEFSVYVSQQFSDTDVISLYNNGLGQNQNIWVPPDSPGSVLVEYFRFQQFVNNPPLINDSLHADFGSDGQFVSNTVPATYVPSIPGLQQAIQTNNNYISFSDAGFPTGNTSFTVGFWINGGASALPPGGNLTAGFVYGNIGVSNGAFLLGVDTNGHIQFDDHDGNGVVSSNIVIGDNQWHYIACTYLSSSHTWTVYVDGVNRGSGSPATFNLVQSGAAYVNQQPSWTNFAANFDIDEPVFFSGVALSQAEIQTIYNRQKP